MRLGCCIPCKFQRKWQKHINDQFHLLALWDSCGGRWRERIWHTAPHKNKPVGYAGQPANPRLPVCALLFNLLLIFVFAGCPYHSKQRTTSKKMRIIIQVMTSHMFLELSRGAWTSPCICPQITGQRNESVKSSRPIFANMVGHLTYQTMPWEAALSSPQDHFQVSGILRGIPLLQMTVCHCADTLVGQKRLSPYTEHQKDRHWRRINGILQARMKTSLSKLDVLCKKNSSTHLLVCVICAVQVVHEWKFKPNRQSNLRCLKKQQHKQREPRPQADT